MTLVSRFSRRLDGRHADDFLLYAFARLVLESLKPTGPIRRIMMLYSMRALNACTARDNIHLGYQIELNAPAARYAGRFLLLYFELFFV